VVRLSCLNRLLRCRCINYFNPKSGSIKLGVSENLELAEKYFNPKSGSIKLTCSSWAKIGFWNFNPKSGSIKFDDLIFLTQVLRRFQSQKWFD